MTVHSITWYMMECCANMLNKYLALRFYVMFFKVISPFSDQVFSNRLTIFARSSILDVWQVSWFCSLFGNNFPFSQQLCHFISWVFDNIYFSFPYLFQESMVLFQLRLTYLHYFELSLTVIYYSLYESRIKSFEIPKRGKTKQNNNSNNDNNNTK